MVLVGVAGGAYALRAAPPRRPSQQANRRGNTTTGSTAVAASQRVSPGDGDLFTLPAVASYLAGTTDGLTAAVYDEVTGVTSLYRPGVAESTASIMKVDILATLLAQGQADGDALSPNDQSLSVDMIEHSDNDDAQDLWDAEGGSRAVSAFDAAAGLTQTDPDEAGYWGLSTTTAADQVQLLRTVAYPNPVLTTGSQNYALNLMTHVEADQAWGVSAGVAPGVTVALKNGWLPLDSGGWQINSIGYVDGAGRDYVIAVLTNANATEAGGIAAVEGLSGLLWQALAPSGSTSTSTSTSPSS